jgi:hypothetical protein
MDLLRAEAILQTGGTLATAQAIIDQTRVTNGGLPSIVGATTQQTWEALWYEQNIEEFMVAGSMAYFRKRGTQALASGQNTHNWGHVTGTPLHYPVAGKELEILQLATYTFGGAGNEMGPVGPGVLASPVSVSPNLVYAFEAGMSVKEKLDFVREQLHERLDDPVVGLTRY